ncbi:hypothetical protein Z957_12340 [Clostridium sp. K25]|uniref:Uncharacterized protein n=1 Tax=Clostridium novyi B str. ATCC 27606 TaxID=1443123 RepID=A0AA40IVQ1_CLONO|nr:MULTISPECIES: hypothetical protein [Clostridium]KEI10829.1 hypothetical protein Z957_12340 [Clostridium sp. K25]KEI17790.1 hypothetical protein Z959_05975 [Clostridium novyi B str. ATCC 27606]
MKGDILINKNNGMKLNLQGVEGTKVLGLDVKALVDKLNTINEVLDINKVANKDFDTDLNMALARCECVVFSVPFIGFNGVLEKRIAEYKQIKESQKYKDEYLKEYKKDALLRSKLEYAQLLKQAQSNLQEYKSIVLTKKSDEIENYQEQMLLENRYFNLLNMCKEQKDYINLWEQFKNNKPIATMIRENKEIVNQHMDIINEYYKLYVSKNEEAIEMIESQLNGSLKTDYMLLLEDGYFANSNPRFYTWEEIFSDEFSLINLANAPSMALDLRKEIVNLI